jgi:hypothetical protein
MNVSSIFTKPQTISRRRLPGWPRTAVDEVPSWLFKVSRCHGSVVESRSGAPGTERDGIWIAEHLGKVTPKLAAADSSRVNRRGFVER